MHQQALTTGKGQSDRIAIRQPSVERLPGSSPVGAREPGRTLIIDTGLGSERDDVGSTPPLLGFVAAGAMGDAFIVHREIATADR